MTMLGGLQIYMLSLIHKWLYGYIPDSKVYGAHMGPTWGRQDPGWPHVGPVMLAIWDIAWAWLYLHAFSWDNILLVIATKASPSIKLWQ